MDIPSSVQSPEAKMSSHKVSHSLCPICKDCKRTISHINLGILPLSGHNVILCTSQSEQMTSLHRVCCGHLLFLVDTSVVYWRPTELSFYTTIRPNMFHLPALHSFILDNYWTGSCDIWCTSVPNVFVTLDMYSTTFTSKSQSKEKRY